MCRITRCVFKDYKHIIHVQAATHATLIILWNDIDHIHIPSHSRSMIPLRLDPWSYFCQSLKTSIADEEPSLRSRTTGKTSASISSFCEIWCRRVYRDLNGQLDQSEKKGTASMQLHKRSNTWQQMCSYIYQLRVSVRLPMHLKKSPVNDYRAPSRLLWYVHLLLGLYLSLVAINIQQFWMTSFSVDLLWYNVK